MTGTLLGLTLPFSKIATEAGVPPILWAFVISFGAGGVLLIVLLLRRHRFLLTGHKLRYFVIAAAISYAIPNLLMFSAIPHLGAGYTGIMFTLSPVITLVLSILLGVRRPNLLGVAGIAIGFVGALIVALTRGEAGQPAALFWVFVGLLIPVMPGGRQHLPNLRLARKKPGRSNLPWAAISLRPQCCWSACCSWEGRYVRAACPACRSWSLAQVASASAMFAFFFRLQAVGGPVYLSQIGYVGAAVGLVSGTLLLGERYQLLTWLGAAIITVGIVMTTKAQRQKA